MRETVCENLKLDAAAHYFQCLVGAYRVANTHDDEPSESSIANCDARFRRAVGQAEASGGCHTPGNPSVLGDSIKVRAQDTALGITAELGGCTALTINDEFAFCTLGSGGRAVNLPAVIDAINAVGNDVDSNTVLYIQAWGGDGGKGNTNNGSDGGDGGYAQTTTTTGAISATYGTTELYYFLGYNGSGGYNAGGDGGTATMVTTNDLATEPASIADTLLIAAGGGGGGGYGGGAGNIDGSSSSDCITGGGGGASLAVASTATCSAAPASKPANPNGSQGFAQIVFDLGGCQ